MLNLRPPIIAALSHSSEMRLKNGARKRLSRRYLEYSSHLSQSIRDEFASYERRLVIDTLVQNTIDSQQDGGRQHSLLANERKTGEIELGPFMGGYYVITGPFHLPSLDTKSTQCLPESSQSSERNWNILLSHPHLNLRRHLTV